MTDAPRRPPREAVVTKDFAYTTITLSDTEDIFLRNQGDAVPVKRLIAQVYPNSLDVELTMALRDKVITMNVTLADFSKFYAVMRARVMVPAQDPSDADLDELIAAGRKRFEEFYAKRIIDDIMAEAQAKQSRSRLRPPEEVLNMPATKLPMPPRVRRGRRVHGTLQAAQSPPDRHRVYEQSGEERLPSSYGDRPHAARDPRSTDPNAALYEDAVPDEDNLWEYQMTGSNSVKLNGRSPQRRGSTAQEQTQLLLRGEEMTLRGEEMTLRHKNRRSCCCVWAGPIDNPVLVEKCDAHLLWSAARTRDVQDKLDLALKEVARLKKMVGCTDYD